PFQNADVPAYRGASTVATALADAVSVGHVFGAGATRPVVDGAKHRGHSVVVGVIVEHSRCVSPRRGSSKNGRKLKSPAKIDRSRDHGPVGLIPIAGAEFPRRMRIALINYYELELTGVSLRAGKRVTGRELPAFGKVAARRKHQCAVVRPAGAIEQKDLTRQISERIVRPRLRKIDSRGRKGSAQTHGIVIDAIVQIASLSQVGAVVVNTVQFQNQAGQRTVTASRCGM